MSTINESKNRIWVVMLAVSILFIGWTVFTISNGGNILEKGLGYYAGSSIQVSSMDEAGRGFLNMAMVKPLWEEIWLGIFGIVFAVGLKRKMKAAWTLSTLWGVMMVANGIVQGSYEMLALGWASPCPQTFIILGLGVIATVGMLVSRKGYSLSVSRRELVLNSKQAM